MTHSTKPSPQSRRTVADTFAGGLEPWLKAVCGECSMRMTRSRSCPGAWKPICSVTNKVRRWDTLDIPSFKLQQGWLEGAGGSTDDIRDWGKGIILAPQKLQFINQTCVLKNMWRGDQDGTVEGCGANLLPHIHRIHLHMKQFSQNTYKSLQKILYNQSCKKDLHVMGRMKGKERRGGVGRGPACRKGAMIDERLPHPGNLSHWPGGQPGQTGSFRGWRGKFASWHVAPQGRERPAQTVLATSLCFPAQDACLLVCAVTGFSRQTWRDSLVWSYRDSPKGLSGHRKKESPLLLCVVFYILYIENRKDATQKLLLVELINDFSKVVGYKVNIQKSV